MNPFRTICSFLPGSLGSRFRIDSDAATDGTPEGVSPMPARDGAEAPVSEMAEVVATIGLLEAEALQAGTTSPGQPDQQLLAALEEHARSCVPVLGPEEIEAQRVRMRDERAGFKGALANARERESWSTAQLHQRRRELAATGEEPDQPRHALWFGLLASLGMSLTFSMAWYEIAIQHFVPDQARGLAVSLVFGTLTVGSYVAHELLEASRQGAHSRGAGTKGLAVLAAFAVGLLASRWCLAVDDQAKILAVGMTLLEVGLGLVVRFQAHRLASAWQHFREEHLLWRSTTDQFIAEQEVLEMTRAEVRELEERLAALDRDMDAAALLEQRRRKLADRAVAAVRRSYLLGVARAGRKGHNGAEVPRDGIQVQVALPRLPLRDTTSTGASRIRVEG